MQVGETRCRRSRPTIYRRRVRYHPLISVTTSVEYESSLPLLDMANILEGCTGIFASYFARSSKILASASQITKLQLRNSSSVENVSESGFGNGVKISLGFINIYPFEKVIIIGQG